MLWTIVYYSLQMWSSTSFYIVYHTLTGTYYMVKYLRGTSRIPIEITPLENYKHSLEDCALKNEKEYDLIISNDSLLSDFKQLHDQLAAIEKNELKNTPKNKKGKKKKKKKHGKP